jgi:hypothetical protein
MWIFCLYLDEMACHVMLPGVVLSLYPAELILLYNINIFELFVYGEYCVTKYA